MSGRTLVLVAGPALAGVDGVVGALRARLPDHEVRGLDGFDPTRRPDAVVAVLSAVAPMTRSDWDLIAHAAAGTDLIVGAVSKIDAHRNWRDVLAADRALAVAWDPRSQPMPWVGVAAAPHLGEPVVADLVAVVSDGLADPARSRRNLLRRNDVPPHRVTVESRVAVQRVRLRLLRFVRAACASLRTDLRDAASSIPAGGAGRFESRVRDDVARFVTDLHGEITRTLDDAAVELGLDHVTVPAGALGPPSVEAPPSTSRRLETRLMVVLGMGVGLGIALASSRLLSGLAPGLAVAGWVAGATLGAAVVAWVVRTRGILHERALLDRWVCDVVATLRWHGEAMVVDRLLSVESALSARTRSGG